MFQVFDLDVAKVNLRCCICCNNNIRMLQAYILKCFRCFKHMFQVFYLDVTKVNLGVAYTCMLQEYVLSVSDVSYICCKCSSECFYMVCYGYDVFCKCFRHMLQVFYLLRMYVASVSFKYCKSRYDVADVATGPVCCNRLLQLLGHRACV
jgi:uncharacterized membrane protein